MVELRRTVRFAVNEPGAAGPDSNGFAGVPSMRGLGRHYELEIACTGETDPLTGYLVNIKGIDRAVRETMIPAITRACREQPAADPGTLLAAMVPPLAAAMPAPLARVRWRLTPFYSVEVHTMATDTVLLRQAFDFSASHRLHVPSMSDAENRECFGKCNSPRGHGHNYRVEPCLAVPGGAPVGLADLERVVEQAIIRPFDHKHLNEDTREFAYEGGSIPTVENIARVFHGLLASALAREFPAAALRSVTVWETDRTSATYPAPAAGA